jgi:membrane protease YdiL (CAAX protease family)
MEGTVALERRLSWRNGLLGLAVAIVATLLLATIVAVVFAAFGSDDTDNHGFQFVATFLGDLALVATAWYVTSDLGRPTLATFGFRPTGSAAVGWVLVAFFSYLVLSGIYTVLVDPPAEDLPEQLGANESVLLAVITGVFVVAVAPFVEELFFRGFLFQALRNSWGTVLGVISSAFIFALIHFEFDKLVPLFFLGVALALLFQKTNSLWPCIALHAINNSLAFAVSL